MRGLNENVSVPDIFCSGLGAVERLEGNCLRLYFYVSQAPEDGSTIREQGGRCQAHRAGDRSNRLRC